MKYEIERENIKFLTTPVPDFDFSKPPVDPLELANNLIETLYASGGYGLAANQCGLPYRCFVTPGPGRDFAFFNPEIIEYSSETSKMDEGCLSFPGLYLKIKRANKIKVRFQLPNEEFMEWEFDGLTARVIQHEIEHLNGELFFAGVGRVRLETAIKRAKSQHKIDYTGKGYMKYA